MKNHTARWVPSILLAALSATMPLPWSRENDARADPQGSLSATEGTQQIRGAIQNVDTFDRVLTLNDGTELTIPPTLDVPLGLLKEWTIVKVNFVEREGEKVVTSLEVQQLEVQRSSVWD